MSIESFKPFLFGKYVSTETHPNGTMLGSTRLAWCLIKLHGGSVSDEMISQVTYECAVEPGLYKRANNPDLQTADDYYGLLAGLALNGHFLKAHETLEYGRRHFWFMNSRKPGSPFPLRTWFGRFPALVAHAYISAKQEPTWLGRKAWCCSVGLCATEDVKKQDSFIQVWSMLASYRASGLRLKDCDEAASHFWRIFKSRQLSMKQIVSAYIGIPDHPLVQHWKDFE